MLTLSLTHKRTCWISCMMTWETTNSLAMHGRAQLQNTPGACLKNDRHRRCCYARGAVCCCSSFVWAGRGFAQNVQAATAKAGRRMPPVEPKSRTSPGVRLFLSHLHAAWPFDPWASGLYTPHTNRITHWRHDQRLHPPHQLHSPFGRKITFGPLALNQTCMCLHYLAVRLPATSPTPTTPALYLLTFDLLFYNARGMNLHEMTQHTGSHAQQVHTPHQDRPAPPGRSAAEGRGGLQQAVT